MLKKKLRLAVTSCAIGALALSASGCSVTATTKAPSSCSPSYTLSNPDGGRISIQQAGYGTSVPWGIYGKGDFKYAHFVVKVYAGGVKVDSKDQNYEPHGSMSAARAKKYSGKEFKVTGSATFKGDVAKFSAVCILA